MFPDGRKGKENEIQNNETRGPRKYRTQIGFYPKDKAFAFELSGRCYNVIACLSDLCTPTSEQSPIGGFVKQSSETIWKEENGNKDNHRQQTHKSVTYQEDLKLSEGRTKGTETKICIESRLKAHKKNAQRCNNYVKQLVQKGCYHYDCRTASDGNAFHRNNKESQCRASDNRRSDCRTKLPQHDYLKGLFPR